jgi:ribosomal protein L22
VADPKQPSKRNAKAESAEEPKEAAKQEVSEAKAEEAKAGEGAKADKPASKAKAEKPAKAAKPAKAEKPAKTEEAAGDDAPEEEKPKPKRRGAAETTTTKKEPARLAPTNADGVVEVRASARHVRNAPRKARLVMDHIRGKRVSDARAILSHTPRAAATDVAKLLESAIANAENNFELDAEELRIYRATVDEGPTIKRFRPRALGRATPIHKRTSHMTIILTTTVAAPGAKKAGRS